MDFDPTSNIPSEVSPEKEAAMLDILMVIVTVGFFGITWAYTVASDRL